jgi:hypothetical protein
VRGSDQLLRALEPGGVDLVFALLAQKKIEPLTAERFPLLGAREAPSLLAKSTISGKLVLLA